MQRVSVTTKTKLQSYGKREAADKLVLEHLGIAKAIALHIYSTIPVHVELDDLIHSGVLGLLDAASKYNPNKQVQFPSYARYRIRGAIFDSLRQLDTASRDLRRRLKEVEIVTRELSAIRLCIPTESEIAARLHIDLTRLRKLMLDGRGLAPISSSFSSSEDELVEREYESRPETRPDAMFSQVQLRTVLEKAMIPLRPRQKQVVQAYYAGCKTMKEIGVSLGINESRVSQLHKSALVKMRTELVASGISSGIAF